MKSNLTRFVSVLRSSVWASYTIGFGTLTLLALIIRTVEETPGFPLIAALTGFMAVVSALMWGLERSPSEG